MNKKENCVECDAISLRLKDSSVGVEACSMCSTIHYGPEHPFSLTMARHARTQAMYPTAYFQWARRDTVAPSRVLQQWWAARYSEAVRLFLPEQCEGGGKWVDVPDEVAPEQAIQEKAA